MRFYSLAPTQVEALPITQFWELNDQIERLRAEDILAWLPAFATSMGGEGVEKIVDGLKQMVGHPMVIEKTTMSADDIQKAKDLFGTG